MSKEINITLAAAEIVRRWDELHRDGLINREATITGILQNSFSHRGTEAQSAEPWPMPPERVKELILSAHNQLRKQFKGVPLWSFVGNLTHHGSGYSHKICEANGWNANQDASLPLV